MPDDKLAELIKIRLTQEDVMTLFVDVVEPIVEEVSRTVISGIHSAALRGQNKYSEAYGHLFPAPIKNGEIQRMVTRKIVEKYNESPDRLFDVILKELEGVEGGNQG
ncbi:hypothetical protein [Paenibacillus oleatilyticus]|uniref:hypothetical protein n=1 Tax=Paenibacillus oleatilyticus TaxID=2594886 RepID=UPI001C1F6221|nr:hypothetical protein [Paenibacillus oleatilyticus]MBU7320268.1 hypothetical protein [Paenibacillus oleatilyticus]